MQGNEDQPEESIRNMSRLVFIHPLPKIDHVMANDGGDLTETKRTNTVTTAFYELTC